MKTEFTYQVVRTEPKGFYQQRPTARALYPQPNWGTPTIYQLPKLKPHIIGRTSDSYTGGGKGL